MRVLFNLIIKIVDFFIKKIITFFKNNSNVRYDALLDVGAHKRDAISIFSKNFEIKNTYSFEVSKNTYHVLETHIDRIKNTYKETNI